MIGVIEKEKKPVDALHLRTGNLNDAEAFGKICYEAFKTIADAHHFPPDFPSPEAAIEIFKHMLGNKAATLEVAEWDGRPAGSNFLWEFGIIAGIGPITIDPALQNVSVGRRLMESAIERARKNGAAGVRLVQAAYHKRSLSLYTKLGFDAREPLSVMQGEPLGVEIPGHRVRKATPDDIESTNQLSLRLHGYTREIELRQAVDSGRATVVESGGRITGYSTGVGFFGHSVAESNDSLKALICAAEGYSGPGFLLPSRNADLLRWSLQHGLRIVQPMTLMSLGLYNEPKGAFLPSILF